MPRCSRGGCNADYVDGSTDTCTHHPGGPVFHEGLKSWSCCSDVSKPVLSFDEFLSIPGCAKVTGHTSEAPKASEPKPAPSATFSVVESSNKDGKETFMTTPAQKSLSTADKKAPPAWVIEEDDPTVPISPGTPCKRKGCGVPFVSDEESRQGDGPGTICVYHPAPPIFREGSKGYLCCKRRVLEFDEFLKIRGCKTGRHVFAVKATALSAADEMVDCRIDHYQTRDKVFVSVFAKQADKEQSVIRFDSAEQVVLDLHLPGSKRFSRVLNLAGPIDTAHSTYHFFNTKIELQLKKADNRGWVLLEKSDRNLEGLNYTFGVGGRSGTVGGKEMYLDAVNKAVIPQ
ncbi:hypothetical protein Agabi119p4_3177 [Agaricus bisporus var. burnettii]|uniref:Chord-domain-containing protein n=1 Tax=Agaricus bisporus var. burnettii TaxID=192524 RepID=A0A8H7F6K4_AGABI|nr:hypothetical protein Agabi119p4_3177 [Agaricus bisporus var. burnettii]